MKTAKILSLGYPGRFLLLALLVVTGTALLHAAEDAQVDPHSVPVVNGGIGPCSVGFTVRDSAGSPIYNAKIKVHIAYGFLGVHKLDLEVGTNIDGKARFDGLPRKARETLHFKASKGDQVGGAFYDPAKSCKAEHSIVLLKPDSSSQP
jgi:hypothetical protein